MFGRRRKAETAEPTDLPESTGDVTPVADEQSAGGSQEPDWEALDAQDWREDGPFDIDEVELDGDGVKRLDLGAIVITPHAGAQLQLQVDDKTQKIVSVVVMGEDAGLELALFAAPRTGGLWADMRDDVLRTSQARGGKAGLAVGPFGTEVRRMMPATTPDGKQGVQPTRMFAVEGPRWLLRGTLLGKAALAEGDSGAAESWVNMYRDVVVRRGEDPMAPGEVIAMELPAGLQPRG